MGFNWFVNHWGRLKVFHHQEMNSELLSLVWLNSWRYRVIHHTDHKMVRWTGFWNDMHLSELNQRGNHWPFPQYHQLKKQTPLSSTPSCGYCSNKQKAGQKNISGSLAALVICCETQENNPFNACRLVYGLISYSPGVSVTCTPSYRSMRVFHSTADIEVVQIGHYSLHAQDTNQEMTSSFSPIKRR